MRRAAFRASRDDFGAALKESGARSGTSLGQSKARSILVVTEVALSLVLLAGAALLLRTFMALRAVHPGFDGHNVLTMEMSLAEARFGKTIAVAQLARDAERRVESLPGIEALAVTSSFPLDPQILYTPLIVEGAGVHAPQAKFTFRTYVGKREAIRFFPVCP